ncbi:hypothetical protein CLW00_102343 [Mongoliibacter ruber]|uniref:Uncharacterized protein n=1 Tax=Mongoliibacter ruber TaxID=1750599 RepID=A0A2T0WT73_9BACT|nr:hypothetical protein CLW00_102343 [Mongoliibacter ruber]
MFLSAHKQLALANKINNTFSLMTCPLFDDVKTASHFLKTTDMTELILS